MKKLSIKMKITIWYTGLILLIMGFAFTLIWLFAGQAVTYQAEKQLKEAVSDSLDGIAIKDGGAVIDHEFE